MRNIRVTNIVNESTNRLREVKNFQNMDICDHINQIIKNTFAVLPSLRKEGDNISNSKPLSRLIFPKKRIDEKNENVKCTENQGDTRYCEQELRFLFVEKFNEYIEAHNLNWYYSVETPTVLKYTGFSGSQAEPKPSDDGQSAMIDLVIFNEDLKRIALIEFKEGNPATLCFKKDFVKLKHEIKRQEGVNSLPLIYFVMYVPSYDEGTIKSLHDTKVYGVKMKDYRATNMIFCCYGLSDKGNKDISEDIENFPNS